MSAVKKKICMLAATPLTIHFFLKPHLIALAKEHDVTLLINLANDNYLPPLDLPIRIISIPIMRKMSPFADFRTLAVLMGFFRKSNYDLLITVVSKAGLLGMMAGFLTGIPKRLHIFQGEVWANRSGFSRLLLKSCDWITAHLATHILAVSASERAFLEEQKVAEFGRIQVLGKGSIGGVNVDRFKPNPVLREYMRHELQIPLNATVLIFMGRLVADKGIRELVKVYQEVHKSDHRLWLLLVGPDEEGEMRNFLNPLGDASNQVRQIDYTNKPEEYLAAADFLCLPSHREGFGVVIIEAAAMGIPAIGSKIYGISDAIISDQTGLLFEVKNSSQLKNCIQKLAKDVDLRSVLGSNARKNVEDHFESGRVIAGYIDYINRLLSR
jgi:glycosyltransferase involved in cell wall biosynthesis